MVDILIADSLVVVYGVVGIYIAPAGWLFGLRSRGG
jgi:hypothetical protein